MKLPKIRPIRPAVRTSFSSRDGGAAIAIRDIKHTLLWRFFVRNMLPRLPAFCTDLTK